MKWELRMLDTRKSVESKHGILQNVFLSRGFCTVHTFLLAIMVLRETARK